jgi:tetratricopeptide (TPR) repeat protein
MSKRLALFDKLIGEGSKDPFHHYARALELRSLGRSDEALAALVQVTDSFADYVPSYLIGAQLAQEKGDAQRARELATRGVAVAQRTGNDHALSELTSLLDSLG